MTEIILKFPLKNHSVTLTDKELIVDLGNGVRLRTEPLPTWVMNIYHVELQLNFVVERGGVTDAITGEPSV